MSRSTSQLAREWPERTSPGGAWRATKIGRDGGAAEIELRPDNPAFKSLRMEPETGDIRVIAEFLEVVE
jgi:hypothetical protein